MGRTFKGGANIFQFVEGASIEILEAPRTHASYETIFEAFSPSSEPPNCVAARREEVLRFSRCRAARFCCRSMSIPVGYSRSPTNAGSRRWPRSSTRHCLRISARAYDRQPDALSRAAWLHIAAPEVFEDAESFLHATHYRTGGKLFEAFEIDLEGAPVFGWSDGGPTQLAEAFTALQLKSKCTITQFDYQPQNGEQHGHMMISTGTC